MTFIDTEVWTPDPDRPGTLTLERTKTVAEVFHEVRERCMERTEFGDHTAVGCNEYFGLMVRDGETLWPRGRIVAYAVTGGSEGHYVHVDVHMDSGARETVILGKTFDGWENAWLFARKIAEALGV